MTQYSEVVQMAAKCSGTSLDGFVSMALTYVAIETLELEAQRLLELAKMTVGTALEPLALEMYHKIMDVLDSYDSYEVPDFSVPEAEREPVTL